MPSTSAKQHRFMEAVAHNPAFAKKAGVSQNVGQDFSKADKGKTFKQGGNTMAKMNPGMMAMMAKKKDGMHKMPDGKMMKDSAMKKGGMAAGGMPMKDGKPAFIGDGKGMAKGGKAYAMGGGVKASSMGKVVAGGKKPHGEHTVQKSGHTKAMMPKMTGRTI